ncbi:MAG: hypothetical protein K0R47_792 [Brevibacillus sp.]|jgi:glyoxylase-like metal-dependent hydrolase (beta-lactamase superfamily II)|nr:hypothetical protein [Brevibacillus sp.]
MNYEKIGPVEIVIGESQSRSPFSTSLLIRDKSGGESTLIDCGGGPSVFAYLQQQNIRQIYLTHFHPDHTSGTPLFDQTQILTNPYDYTRLLQFAEMRRSQATGTNSTKAAGTAQLIYPYEQEINMSGTTVIMLHAPGHSEGFCCPYIPEHGILMIGDIDLTSFGPWYFGPDSDIDQFIASARMTLEVEAKYLLTSHQKGMVLQGEYPKKLEQYLEIIDRREERIKQAIKRGCSPAELILQDVIYFRKDHEQAAFIVRNEQMGIAKHLKRMIRNGEPLGDYFLDFALAHKLNPDYVEQFTRPAFVGKGSVKSETKMN